MRNQPTRVLHVVHGLPIGGLENGVVNLVNGLPRSDFEQAVCCLDAYGEMASRISRGVPIWNLARRKHDISTPVKLARVIRDWSPHVVHSRNWSTWPDSVVARRLAWKNCALVWSFHGFAEEQPFPARRRIASRLLAKNTDRLLSVGKSAAEQFAELTGVPRHQFSVIHNGVDCDRFKPSVNRPALRRELRLPEEALIVVTVASLTRVKDHETLLSAVAHVNNERIGREVLFILLGDGPERHKLESLARTLGIAGRVAFKGTTTETHRYLAAADLFVLPSKNEGLSNAVLEAMASGLAAVVTNVGGNSELVVHAKTGYICSSGDASGMANAIVSLLSSEPLREGLGRVARQSVIEGFSLQGMLNRYSNFYRSFPDSGRRDRRYRQ